MKKRKRKVKTKTKPTYRVEVLVRTETYRDEDTREDPYEPYTTRPDTHTSHYVRGIRLAKQEGYVDYDVVVDFEPQHGVPYHLVYAQYSTGDSFGHDRGRGFEIVGLYRSRDVADKIVADIKQYDRKERTLRYGYDPLTHKSLSGKEIGKLQKELEDMFIIGDDGKREKLYTPWIGYFDSLDYVEVQDFTLI